MTMVPKVDSADAEDLEDAVGEVLYIDIKVKGMRGLPVEKWDREVYKSLYVKYRFFSGDEYVRSGTVKFGVDVTLEWERTLKWKVSKELCEYVGVGAVGFEVWACAEEGEGEGGGEGVVEKEEEEEEGGGREELEEEEEDEGKTAAAATDAVVPTNGAVGGGEGGEAGGGGESETSFPEENARLRKENTELRDKLGTALKYIEKLKKEGVITGHCEEPFDVTPTPRTVAKMETALVVDGLFNGAADRKLELT